MTISCKYLGWLINWKIFFEISWKKRVVNVDRVLVPHVFVQLVAFLVHKFLELLSSLSSRNPGMLHNEHFNEELVKWNRAKNVQLCSFNVQAEQINHRLIQGQHNRVKRKTEGFDGLLGAIVRDLMNSTA